jgi:magnesium transporter
MIVHNAVYASGLRIPPGSSPKSHDRRQHGAGFTWIDLYEPTAEEFDCVTRKLGLDHPLALEFVARNDRWLGVKHYNDQTLLVVLKSVRYVDAMQPLKYGEIQVFVGPDFVATVRRGEASKLHNMYQLWLAAEREGDWLLRDPAMVLDLIADGVVDGYSLAVAGLQNSLDKIRPEVSEDPNNALHRIYRLYGPAIYLRMEARSLTRILKRLTEEGDSSIDSERGRYLGNVRAHLERVMNNIEGFCNLLSSLLQINSTTARTNKYKLW